MRTIAYSQIDYTHTYICIQHTAYTRRVWKWKWISAAAVDIVILSFSAKSVTSLRFEAEVASTNRKNCDKLNELYKTLNLCFFFISKTCWGRVATVFVAAAILLLPLLMLFSFLFPHVAHAPLLMCIVFLFRFSLRHIILFVIFFNRLWCMYYDRVSVCVCEHIDAYVSVWKWREREREKALALN